MPYKKHHAPDQQGAALLVTLVLLIGVTVVSLASLNTALLEQRMAGAEENRMVAFNESQAVVDALTDPNNDYIIVGAGGVGTKTCTTNYAADPGEDSCNTTSLELPSDTFSDEHSGFVERLSPEFANLGRATQTSALHGLKAANFGVHGRVNNLSKGGGRARVTMGYLKLFLSGTGEVTTID